MVYWREDFQRAVNKIAGGDFLQFTVEMWIDQSREDVPDCPPTPEEEYHKDVSVVRDKEFPFLDMKLLWSEEGNLQFQIYRKPNQQLRYLNKGSTHTKACFKAIPTGVFKRMAKLTTVTEDNADKSLRELYPKLFAALDTAELLKGTRVPTLAEEIKKLAVQPTTKDREARQKERSRRRMMFFCVVQATQNCGVNQSLHLTIN